MFFFVPLRLDDRSDSQPVPLVNACLIAGNILVHLLGVGAADPAMGLWGIIVYAFLHKNVVHLATNMWLLLVFGNPINRRLGNGYYLACYLGVITFLGLIRMATGIPLIGASGGVYAVIAMAVLLLPSAMIDVAFFALAPISLLVGLVARPSHWLEWLIRADRVRLRVYWCAALVPLMILFGSFWLAPWANVAHLVGLACGVAAVLLLPRAVAMARPGLSGT